MSRFIVLVVLCLSVLAPANITAAQDASDLEAYIDEPVPIARFGWGVPYGMTYLSDNKTLAVVSGAGIAFYDEKLNEQGYINTEDHAPHTLAISPDERTLATGSDEDVRLWYRDTGVLLDVLDTGRSVGGLAFSADGRLLAVSKGWGSPYDDVGILIYEVASGRLLQRVAEDYIFKSVAFLSDNDHLVAHQVYDCCGQAIWIDLNSGDILNLVNEVEMIRPVPDKNVILSVQGWPVESKDGRLPEVRQPDYHPDGYVIAMNAINTERHFVTLTSEGEMITWDAESLEQVRRLDLGFKPKLATISPDGTRAATIKWDEQTIVTIDTETGAEYAQQAYPLVKASHLILMGNHDMGDVIYAHDNGSLSYWNIWTDEHGNWRGHREASEGRKINALVAASSGDIYSAGDDGAVRVWRVGGEFNGEVLFEQQGVQITALMLSYYLRNGEIHDELYAVICEDGNGSLVRLDRMTGVSLGFYPDRGTSESSLSALSLQTCGITFIPVRHGDLRYADGQYAYRVENLRADSIARFPIPMSSTHVYMDLHLNPWDAPALMLSEAGTAFDWRPSDVVTGDLLTIIASHALEITALARVDQYQYVSAACAHYGYVPLDGSPYCVGADMAMTEVDLDRVSLIGHSGVVNQIAAHPTLALFASASDDGTIILWGNPREPVPVRRVVPRLMG